MMLISATALFGIRASVDTPAKLQEVRNEEDRIVELKIATGDIQANPHKEAAPLDRRRATEDDAAEEESPAEAAATNAAGN